MPTESNGDRLSHCFTRNDDGVSLNCRIGFDEVFILTGNLKPCEGFAIARHQAAADKIKTDADGVPINFH